MTRWILGVLLVVLVGTWLGFKAHEADQAEIRRQLDLYSDARDAIEGRKP